MLPSFHCQNERNPEVVRIRVQAGPFRPTAKQLAAHEVEHLVRFDDGLQSVRPKTHFQLLEIVTLTSLVRR